MKINNKIVIERLYLDDKRVKPQTIKHHLERYKFVYKYLKPVHFVLDLACGSGYGTNLMHQHSAHCLGVDISKEAIKYATTTYPNTNYIQCDILEIIDSYFSTFRRLTPMADVITFFEALEHFDKFDGVRILNYIYAELDENGKLYVSVPRDINKKNNGFHKSEYTFDEFKQLLGHVFGLKNVKFYGQDWDTGKITTKNVKDNDFYIAVCTKTN